MSREGRKNMQLRINNISIRDFEADDINKKVEIINDELNNKFLHYNLPLEYENTLKWYNNKDNSNRLDCSILYDNQVCGFIGLLSIDKKNNKAEYYICVDHNFSGKNIGTDATKLLLEYAFNELKLERIYLFTEENNSKAQHLFEKVGFKQEGLLYNDLIYNNRKINRYVYAIVKES